MTKAYVGIDIGGTNVKIGIFDGELELASKTSVPVEADIEPEAMVDLIGDTIEKILAEKEMSLDAVEAAGVGSTGQFNLTKGFMISNPNLTKFQNVPLRDMLSKRLGKPTVVDNDGNAACWGEYALGAGKGVSEMILFTLGTGIGSGVVCRGELLHGCGDNAAELGHMIIYPDGRLCGCGQHGCVEAHASAKSTGRKAQEAVEAGEQSSLTKVLEENGAITCKDVYDHLKAGDELAKKVTDDTAKALAILCVNVLHATEPERIVFAGGMIAAGDVLLNKIKEYFNEHIWKMKKETVEICFAVLGGDAGIIGAAALAKHEKDLGRM